MVRVGKWLSVALAVVVAVFTVIALLDQHVVDVGGLDVGEEVGIGVAGYAFYGVQVLGLIWLGVLIAAGLVALTHALRGR